MSKGRLIHRVLARGCLIVPFALACLITWCCNLVYPGWPYFMQVCEPLIFAGMAVSYPVMAWGIYSVMPDWGMPWDRELASLGLAVPATVIEAVAAFYLLVFTIPVAIF